VFQAKRITLGNPVLQYCDVLKITIS